MILDPTAHSAGVQAFMRAARISGGDPSLGLLHKLVEAFSRFPYENISKIIKLSQNLDKPYPIRLPEEVIENHLRDGLGGTCFSMSYTLQAILIQNGFECYPVMAHMRAGNNIHCALVVRVDGIKYLIDPGYLLGRPVELHHRRPAQFANEFSRVEVRFDPADQVYHLYTWTGPERKWRYRFVDRPTGPEEFLKHWQTSFHQNAMHGICLNKTTSRGLIYIRKTFMREITPQGRHNVNIKRSYHAAIEETFGISPDLVEQALAALEVNMAWERQHGFYAPKGRGYETIGA